MKTLKNLLNDELSARLDGERQIAQAMPRIIEMVTSPQLKTLLSSHYKETEGQIVRLERVFKALDEKPSSRKCQSTAALLKEVESAAAAFKGSPAINAAISSTVQKIEHYEIASYECLHEWAEACENEAAVDLLRVAVNEETKALKVLGELARSRCNAEALGRPSREDSRGNSLDEIDGPPVAGQQL